MPDDDIGTWLWHLELANTAIHDGLHRMPADWLADAESPVKLIVLVGNEAGVTWKTQAPPRVVPPKAKQAEPDPCETAMHELMAAAMADAALSGRFGFDGRQICMWWLVDLADYLDRTPSWRDQRGLVVLRNPNLDDANTGTIGIAVASLGQDDLDGTTMAAPGQFNPLRAELEL